MTKPKNVFFALFLSAIFFYSFPEHIIYAIAEYPRTEPEKVSSSFAGGKIEYFLSSYNPPVSLQLVPSRAESNYSTPEAAVMSFISSIIKNDFEWWFNSFDQFRQNDLLTNKKSEYDDYKTFQLRNASDKYSGKIIKLISYISYEEYILIDSVAYNADGTRSFKILTALKFEEGSWKITTDQDAMIFVLLLSVRS